MQDSESRAVSSQQATQTFEMVEGCSTPDLALASYLLAKGYKLRLEFRFLEAGLDLDIDAFDNGAAIVEPKKYEQARCTLQRTIDVLEELRQ